MSCFSRTVAVSLSIMIVVSLIKPEEIFAQTERDSRRAYFLSGAEKSTIKDAAGTHDLDKIRALVRKQPRLVRSISKKYAKHSGADGKQAGEAASVIAKAINADISQASEIAAIIYRRKNATIEDAVEIADKVATDLGFDSTIDKYSLFVGLLAKELNLDGKEASQLAVQLINKHGYRGYEAGHLTGLVARGTGATREDLQLIVSSVLRELKPDINEADQIASTVALETGEEISVSTSTARN